MAKWITVVLFLALVAFFLFGGSYFLRVKQALRIPWGEPSAEESLRAENAVLRSEIEKLLSFAPKGVAFKEGMLRVVAYAPSPLRGKAELMIGAGEEDGIRAGMPVLYKGILLGTVKRTSRTMSSVATIFDPEFETAVRIGDKAVEALFHGGPVPEVALIPKDAGVESGSMVYSAREDIPYGLPLGELDLVPWEEADAWGKGTLRVPYDPLRILEVEVVTTWQGPKEKNT